MKKLFMLIILLSFFSFIYTPALKANNYNGSELSYICLGGQSYLVTYTFYTDCSSIPGPNNVNIVFKCQSNSALNFTINANKTINSGNEVTRACPHVNTSCNGTSWYGIRSYVYQAQVVLPPCNSWEISVSNCCRALVTTVTNPSNNSHYALALLNNLNAPCNSSPTFTNGEMNPRLIIEKGQDLNLHFGTLEADGDSLVYSLVPPKTSISAGVNYISGLSATNFLYATSPGITLNPQTGDIYFNATQSLTTIFCLKVEEYRKINGLPVLIGTVHRDIQLKVAMSNNIAPSLSGMDFTQTHTYNSSDTIYSYHHCMDGNPIVFDINGFDPDTFNSSFIGQEHIFNIGWNNGIPGAYFTTHYNGTDSAYANFNWLPDSFMVGKTYFFTAYVQDSACPYNGYQSYTYAIALHPKQTPFSLGNDTVIDMNQALFLSLPNGYDNYLWSTGDTSQVLILTSMLAYTNPIVGTVYNDNDCMISDTINITFTVGVDVVRKPEVKIYPNPVQNTLYINLSRKYTSTQIEIFDYNGKLVRKAIFSGSYYKMKSLRNLSNGLYVVRLTNYEISINKKFVIQH